MIRFVKPSKSAITQTHREHELQQKLVFLISFVSTNKLFIISNLRSCLKSFLMILVPPPLITKMKTHPSFAVGLRKQKLYKMPFERHINEY